MGRLLSILLWTTVFLLIVLAVDQLLVRVPASLPVHVAVADFYRDLRSRILVLVKEGKTTPAAAPAATAAKPVPPSTTAPREAPASVEAVIDQRQAPRVAAAKVPSAAGAAKRPATKGATPRYVYADDQGTLHFAATLDEVPETYRGKVKVLGE